MFEGNQRRNFADKDKQVIQKQEINKKGFIKGNSSMQWRINIDWY